jgi:hypothetical protein
MTTPTQYTYAKQQFISDVSLNGSTTMSSVNVTGNVGIGTTNPSNQLDVSGTISSRNLLLQGDGTDAYIRPTNASSSLYLGSNNNNHMKISSAGNVGIGTNSPGCTLDVNGTTRINGQLDISNFINMLSGTYNNPTYIYSGRNSDNSALIIQVGNNPGVWSAIRMYSGWNGVSEGVGKLEFYTQGTERMRIVGNGNVGIGTTNPEDLLHVNGVIRSRTPNLGGVTMNPGSSEHPGHISFYHPNGTTRVGYIGWQQPSNYLSLKVENGYLGYKVQENLLVGNNLLVSGNIGIGTDSSAHKLHVVGDTYCTGYTRVASWGIYYQPNDGYLQPNDQYYGNWKMHGNAVNTWNGIRFPQAEISLMCGYGTTKECGFHYNGDNWAFRVDSSKNAFVSGYLNISGYAPNDWNSYLGFGIAGANNYSGNLISLICAGSVKSGGPFITTSDKRIKNNIVDINDSHALSILRQIKPKTYEYVDKVQRGYDSVIGFIAQEIKEILPKAVTITKDYIPNFYKNCVISTTDASNIVLVTSPFDLSWNPLHDHSGNAFVDAAGNACSDADGNKFFNVKLYDQSNNEIMCKTTNVLDKQSFLMDVTGSKMVDASGNLVLEKDGEYFLYGQEVDDFHALDKNAIFTVVTAAVQDIDRIVQESKQKQEADAARIAALESQIAAQQAQIAAILAKLDM